MAKRYRGSVAELKGSDGVAGVYVYVHYDDAYGGIYACATMAEFKNGMMILPLNAPRSLEWVVEGFRRCSDKRLKDAVDTAKKQIEARVGPTWKAVSRVAKHCGITLNP